MKSVILTVLLFVVITAALFLWTGNRRQVLIAFDQLINARLGGWADETFSARCWRQRRMKKYEILTKVIDAIFFWQDDHCRKAYESEIKRSHLPVYYRDSGK